MWGGRRRERRPRHDGDYNSRPGRDECGVVRRAASRGVWSGAWRCGRKRFSQPRQDQDREDCRADQLDPREFGPEFADLALEFGFQLDEVGFAGICQAGAEASVIASA